MEDNQVTEPEVQTNEEVAETPVETPEEPQEETPQEPEQEAEVEPEQPETEEAEPEPKPQSRRESLRIAKLVEKQLQQQRQAQTPPGMDYSTALEADPATVSQLEADRQQYGKSLYEQGLQQANSIQFKTRLEVDAPRIEAKYPQLDKNSDQFDPVIADGLNTHYLNLVGYDPQTDTVQNPSLRYADFIEAQYELAGVLANDKVSKTSRNIAKQAATTGLRPGGNSSKRMNLNQDPSSMSKEELDAKIASDLKTLKTIR